MKHQQVSVDYWAMFKAMLVYGALTGLCWIMMRLFSTAFSLPRRLRAQQDQAQHTLQELQKRFPDLNITEDDLKNAEKDYEDLLKEIEEEKKNENKNENEKSIEDAPKETVATAEENKKTI